LEQKYPHWLAEMTIDERIQYEKDIAALDEMAIVDRDLTIDS
jgi:hypothetical protein